MNRYLLLFALVIVTVLGILFFTRPQILDNIWMWLVGFAGYVALFFRKASDTLKKLLRKISDGKTDVLNPVEQPPSQPVDPSDHLKERIRQIEEKLAKDRQVGTPLANTTLCILRYLDDGQTTLGLLFLHGRFFAYTLEDTHRDVKLPGGTRIPEGIYPLEPNKTITDLTVTYRNRFSWFDYHLEIRDIPNFSKVYIHIGNTHTDTEGCILIADGVNASDPQKMLTHSRLAFERFYKTVYPLLQEGKKLTIQVLNEDWFNHAQLVPTQEPLEHA